ncbi:MAG TPA: carboxy terminal-processing peptidase [Lacunisphaera sp.]|nr:carboxy terminal-processing peptidase [Lacunisphaera sp.]
MKSIPRLLSGLLLTSLLASSVFAAAAPDRELKTTPVMRSETRYLVQMLEYFHYNKDAVTTADYPELIKAYMQELDPQRLFFTLSDEQNFRKLYGPRIETDLTYLGSIDTAFDIYKVYEQRVQARATWIFSELPKDFDFTAQESYTPDRSKSPFPATTAEADDLWRKRLKFEMLHDLLGKKTQEEAKTTLRKRYERMLKNLGDIEARDIQEMFLSSLTRMYDPHSDFLSSDSLQDFSIQMKLSLVGIGAVLGLDEDHCIVREIKPGTPADLSGQIHVNDKIVAVQQEGGETVDIIGMKLRRIVDMIRGAKGTKVTLTILPHNAVDATQTKQVHIVRDVVKLDESRATAMIYDMPGAQEGQIVHVGVIELRSFYDGSPENSAPEDIRNTASEDIAELIGKLKAEGIQALVIDLRRNGGGLLSEAVNLTGLFIKDGPVVQERDFQGQINVDSDTNSTVAYDGPLAILTSRFSASASEIFAGAMQNYGRAVIIGDSSTHGKGTVQAVLEMKNYIPRMQDLQNTGAAKLTVRKFYLPNGSSTQNKGVTPDIVLPSIDDYLPNIGESSLPHALMWDEIKPTKFTGKAIDSTFLQPLRQASLSRQDSLEEFSYLKKNIDWFKERQEEKAVSLNLEQRLARKQADDDYKKILDAERDRLAKNNYTSREIKLASVLKAEASAAPKPAPAKTDENTDGDTDTVDSDTESKLDVHLRETLRVVTDALRLNGNPLAWVEPQAPSASTSLHKG